MTLKDELQNEQVSHLDLTGFSRVPAGTPIGECIQIMRREKHNVALVMDQGKLVGIFTERDVLRKIAISPDLLTQPVEQAMTHDPITVGPETSAADALWLMDARHFRNLPVVDGTGKVLGTMTHQTVIDYLAARYPQEILNRPPVPEQFPRKPEGG